MHILGIDVGGSGIKGASVDLETGELLAERIRIKTPKKAEPEPVAEVVKQIAQSSHWNGPIGIGFPAPIKAGVAMMPANISDKWMPEAPPRRRSAMSAVAASWLAIAAYCLVMLGIGAWAARRAGGAEDFFLGGRRLGPWIVALAQGATQSSAWTLVGVSAAAFARGLPAVWIWVAVVSGYAVNWFWVAPRLRRLSADEGSLTLVQLIAGRDAGRGARRLRQSASVVIYVSFLFYVAAQFQAAGQAFSVALDLPLAACIVAGSAVVVAYTLSGGFWAATVTDCGDHRGGQARCLGRNRAHRIEKMTEFFD